MRGGARILPSRLITSPRMNTPARSVFGVAAIHIGTPALTTYLFSPMGSCVATRRFPGGTWRQPQKPRTLRHLLTKFRPYSEGTPHRNRRRPPLVNRQFISPSGAQTWVTTLPVHVLLLPEADPPHPAGWPP